MVREGNIGGRRQWGGSAREGLLPVVLELQKGLSKKVVAKKKKKQAGNASDAAAALTKKLTSVPAVKRLAVLANVIQGKVIEVLGVEDGSVVSQTGPLSELGLDSLMATELIKKNVLEDLVGQSLPRTLCSII